LWRNAKRTNYRLSVVRHFFSLPRLEYWADLGGLGLWDKQGSLSWWWLCSFSIWFFIRGWSSRNLWLVSISPVLSDSIQKASQRANYHSPPTTPVAANSTLK
jgi:hypothetical protein